MGKGKKETIMFGFSKKEKEAKAKAQRKETIVTAVVAGATVAVTTAILTKGTKMTAKKLNAIKAKRDKEAEVAKMIEGEMATEVKTEEKKEAKDKTEENK